MNVWHIAAECAPYAKIGGLGDVIGALPGELVRAGIGSEVIMPGYAQIDLSGAETVWSGKAAYGGRKVDYEARALLADNGYRVIFIVQPEWFGSAGVYQDAATGEPFPNDADRFPGFQACVADYLASIAATGVIHLHDHHTALLAPMIRLGATGLPTDTSIIFTIHSADHQGILPAENVRKLGLSLDGESAVNSMAMGVRYANRITTVSPSYASQLLEEPALSAGLQPEFLRASSRFSGIVNGADPKIWRPENDPVIPIQFDADRLEGKAKMKALLLDELGIEPRGALVTFIGRLMEEKGVEILGPIIDRALTEHADVTVCVLGTGKKVFEKSMAELAEKWKGAESATRLRVVLAFDNGLAHRLYAGSDILLMPSRSEPCGLNQLYALAYGTIPVVHAVGGLRDTVMPWSPSDESGTGFLFEAFDAESGVAALNEALAAYSKPESWERLMTNGMKQDWSWGASARKYLDLYSALANEI